jgi:hypothetical protein
MIMKKYFVYVALLVLVSIPVIAMALTEQEIKSSTHIVNLEANPVWFRAGQPIDFIVTVKYDGGTQDGFDVGVFHESRLVGWEMNKRFNSGMNTFKVHDAHFRGDPGAYIVKLRFKSREFTQKSFVSKSNCMFTIDPRAEHPGR